MSEDNHHNTNLFEVSSHLMRDSFVFFVNNEILNTSHSYRISINIGLMIYYLRI